MAILTKDRIKPHDRRRSEGTAQAAPLRLRQDRTRQAVRACRHGPRYGHGEGSHETPVPADLRTAALLVAIQRGRQVALECGIWP
jgi:hypothetical protein